MHITCTARHTLRTTVRLRYDTHTIASAMHAFLVEIIRLNASLGLLQTTDHAAELLSRQQHTQAMVHHQLRLIEHNPAS